MVDVKVQPHADCIGGNDVVDFAILEQGAFIWDEAKAHDGLNWSPFHGDTFTVRVGATYLRGACGFDGNTITGRQGSGRYVARGADCWFGN